MSLKSNFISFRKAISKTFREKIEKRDNFVKGVIVSAYADIIQTSPVDTGYFRANNMLEIGKATFSTIPKVDGKDYKSESESNINSANSDIKNVDFNKNGLISISNALPYAERLEDGYSRQSEQMFQRALVKAKRKLKGYNGWIR